MDVNDSNPSSTWLKLFYKPKELKNAKPAYESAMMRRRRLLKRTRTRCRAQRAVNHERQPHHEGEICRKCTSENMRASAATLKMHVEGNEVGITASVPVLMSARVTSLYCAGKNILVPMH